MIKKAFIENLAQELANSEWKEITPKINVEDTKFDLYATRKSLQKWRAYIMTSLQFIDQPTFQEYVKIYETFKKKDQSWTIGHISILCVIAEKGMSPDIIPKVNKYSLGLFQKKSGGCLLCIVDLPKRATYMKVPRIPWPVHRIGKEFKEIINHALSK